MNAPIPPPPKLLDDNEINVPDIRFEIGATVLDGPGANLYLEVFVPSDVAPGKWHSAHQNSWPLLASVTPKQIRMFPIHANPHAQRYRSPQHGSFSSVVYVDDSGDALPTDADDALRQISTRLPGSIFRDYTEGLGLHKEFDEVVKTIAILGKNAALKIVEHGASHVEADEVIVSEEDMDSLRRAMNRIDRRKREGVRHAKQVTVFNDLLTKLDPARFGRSEPVAMKPLTLPARGRARSARTLQRRAREAAVSSVRANLSVLAAETPAVLMQLQAEIERVTLTEMIAKYDELLRQDLPEGKWQEFFETYKFVLSLVFSRPVQLLHTQFHAQSSAVDGSGAQIGDFLLKLTGRGLAIVEIKKPGTELLSGTAYRNTQVFAPSRELGGAVTQTLIQQNALRVEWAQHFLKDKRLRESGPEAIRCVVIAGRLPDDEHQLASFEAFRNACKDVEVLTFDELLEKLKYICDELSPPPLPAATVEHDVPF